MDLDAIEGEKTVEELGGGASQPALEEAQENDKLTRPWHRLHLAVGKPPLSRGLLRQHSALDEGGSYLSVTEDLL
jgi:hypothetical protein